MILINRNGSFKAMTEIVYVPKGWGKMSVKSICRLKKKNCNVEIENPSNKENIAFADT